MRSFNYATLKDCKWDSELLSKHLLYGRCFSYAQITRNGKGEVVALYPLMPSRPSFF